MNRPLWSRTLPAVVIAIAIAALAGCATSSDQAPAPAAIPSPAPTMDGGIVGTGYRVDCEPRTAKDGSEVPLPSACKREGGATR
jgi:hypothetical protein